RRTPSTRRKGKRRPLSPIMRGHTLPCAKNFQRDLKATLLSAEAQFEDCPNPKLGDGQRKAAPSQPRPAGQFEAVSNKGRSPPRTALVRKRRDHESARRAHRSR